MDEIFSYVIKNFNLSYGIRQFVYDIQYGVEGPSKIQVKKTCAAVKELENLDLDRVTWIKWKNEEIPCLYGDNITDEVVTYGNGKAVINFDIVASAFYFLSNWQEILNTKKDQFGRYPYTESIQYRLQIVKKPIVNYYFDILKTTIEKVYDTPLNAKHWGANDYALCLTHDIDACKSAWIQGSFREIIARNYFAPFKLLFKRVFCKDDWFNFAAIISLEKEYEAYSSFYFLPYKGKKQGIIHADYTIESHDIQNSIKLIIENGSEAGLHGSMGSHADELLFNRELAKFKKQVIGTRFHFLMFDAHVTPQILAKSGVKYDTTLGFAESIGFRNSCCTPFYLFDHTNFRCTNVVEIPLMVMDTTFSEKKYMGLDKEAALAEVKHILKEVKKHNGCVSVLWHNVYFSDYKYKGWKDVYKEILAYCREDNALLTSGEKIVNQINS